MLLHQPFTLTQECTFEENPPNDPAYPVPPGQAASEHANGILLGGIKAGDVVWELQQLTGIQSSGHAGAVRSDLGPVPAPQSTV